MSTERKSGRSLHYLKGSNVEQFVCIFQEPPQNHDKGGFLGKS
jgi:hypothetical protein